MNTERDTYNQIEYARETGREEGLKEGREEGREEGLKEGREEGREEGRKEGKEEGLKEGQSKIAMNLIKLGTPCKIIAQATGFSEEEVSRLKKEMSNA